MEKPIRIGVNVSPGLYRHGLELTMGLLDYARSVAGWVVESVQAERVARGTGLAGAIAHGSEQTYRALRAAPIPVVNISNMSINAVEALPGVLNDDPEVGRVAGRYLVERGYRTVAFDGIPGHHYSHERLAGLREVLEAAGGRVVVLPTIPPQNARLGLAHVIEVFAPSLSGLGRPFAAVGCNDQRAKRLGQICLALGWLVPEEVAVLGIDNDILQCRMAEPELSSVETDAHRIGYEAALLLDRLMQGQSPPTKPSLVPPTGVVERRSTDAFAVDDETVARALRWFREHAAEGINVAEAAAALRVPRRSLEVRFRKALGRTPLDELRRVRLERCKELLIRTDFAMPDVAARAGFRDAKVMGMTFRQHVGQTPTTYRATYRSA